MHQADTCTCQTHACLLCHFCRYDFTIYSQMSKILGKVFFPSNDSTMQALRCVP